MAGENSAPPGDEQLIEVLSEARDLGFLGPGPVDRQVGHSRAFLAAMETFPQGRAMDLGSGGGVPGLVLARDRPGWQWVLLDSSARRSAFLARAVASLGMEGRVEVVTDRAEEVARLPRHRGTYDLVVARSFAGPPVVAECAAPLLAPGGHLIVSEPPDGQGRWPQDGLARLGLRLVTATAGPPRLATLRQETWCPERFPRRVGIPSKRPLW